MTSLPNCGAGAGVPAGRSSAGSPSGLTLVQSAEALLPRWNLDQLRQLFLGQGCGGVLQYYSFGNDRVEADDLVRSTDAGGKKSSRVRFAMSTEIPTNSA